MKLASDKKVVMAKSLAKQWLRSRMLPEYRLTIYYANTANEIRSLPRLFKAFRDGKTKVAGIEPITDLGISTNYDSIVVWSSDREGMVKIRDWLESRKYETNGVW